MSDLRSDLLATPASAAKSLSTTILGMISFFLLVTYFTGVLCLFFAKLSQWDQTIALLFIVTFPVVILIVFYKLVTEHYPKIMPIGTVSVAAHERILVAELTRDRLDRLEDGKNQAELFRTMVSASGESEKQILIQIHDWYSEEWRQRRRIFREAAKELGDKPDQLELDETRNVPVLAVLNFLTGIGVALRSGLVRDEVIPVAFKRSVARYLPRSKKWLDYIREREADPSRYEDFEFMAQKWRNVGKLDV
jgi:hypothetical protein